MNERVVEFRVGVLVLASFVLAGIMVLLFRGSAPLFEGTREVRISIENARGVSQGTPIRKRGILVGRVTRVEFDDDEQRVLLTAAINNSVEIFQDDVFQLRVSLLGDAEIEISEPQVVPEDRSNTQHTVTAKYNT